MCRLFGMSGGPRRVRAAFWSLEAPDSLSDQSYRNPDGAGIGTVELDGTPELDKSPIAAYKDRSFVREAKTEESRTFVAHVRFSARRYAGCFAHSARVSSLAACRPAVLWVRVPMESKDAFSDLIAGLTG